MNVLSRLRQEMNKITYETGKRPEIVILALRGDVLDQIPATMRLPMCGETGHYCGCLLSVEKLPEGVDFVMR